MDAKLAFENDCKWGETMLRERGEVRPMFVVHCELGLIPVLATFANAREKRMTYDFVRLLCAAYAAHAVAFIMEAWGADGLGDGTPPSQRPDRYEMLVVTLASRGENGIEKLASTRKMIRDTAGKFVALADANMATAFPGAEMEGPAFELLPERAPTPEETARAKQKLKLAGIETEWTMAPTLH